MDGGKGLVTAGKGDGVLLLVGTNCVVCVCGWNNVVSGSPGVNVCFGRG